MQSMTDPQPVIPALPAALYFLQDGQIWHLSQDSQTITQITFESDPVDAYDFSLLTHKLVFVSDNQLIMTDSGGTDRQVLIAGQKLKPELDELARFNDLDYIQGAIRTPHWSSDGARIAFIMGGVRVYDVQSKQIEVIWENSVRSSEPVILDHLLSWSPDGEFFLVSYHTLPLKSLYQRTLVLIKTGESLVYIGGQAQSTFAWSPDKRYLFLADALFGDNRSLRRCDLTEIRCAMIASFEPGMRYHFYAHPYIVDEGDYFVFSGSSKDMGQPPENFWLVRARVSGGSRNLYDTGFSLQAALWSSQGDGVIIITAQDKDEVKAGSLLWLNIQNNQIYKLPPLNASDLRWGSAQ